MTNTDRRMGTRAERLSMPLARDVVKDLAIEHGACIRPVQLRRTDLATGEVEPVLVPCGHTLASVCPPCAERAKNLRAAQCREGWHLEHEPVIQRDESTDQQKWWIEKRADAQVMHDGGDAPGWDAAELDELLSDLDEEINGAGMRGNVLPARPQRRHRSTRRRQDAAPLPRRTADPRTVGKSYTAPDGKTFRPSLFVTLTCPSYGQVTSEGTPVDSDSYDYVRAGRDALHFAALFDRFIQNLRRLVGYDVQYFAAIEPQRRLAPHVHVAIRGTVSRAVTPESVPGVPGVPEPLPACADPGDKWGHEPGTGVPGVPVPLAVVNAADRLSRGEAVPGGPGACAQCGHLTLWHGVNGRYRNKPCTKCDCPAYTDQECQ